MAPAQTRVDLGPTGHAVAENVKRLRVELGLSLRELADRLEENGHAIAHSGLSKIENKTRRVDADDLAALSIALGVSPVALLLPAPADPRARITLTGWSEDRAFDLWRWATAGAPLGDGEPLSSLPWWLAVDVRFVLEGVHPAAEEREIGRRVITRTETVTLDESDPRVPFLVDGATLDDPIAPDGVDPEAS